ncbi:MAG: amino acid ABC transporter permease [Comamonas sp.]
MNFLPAWLDLALPQLLAAKYWQWLLGGWSVTILSSSLVIALSTVLGMGFAVARSAAFAPLRWAAVAYLSAFRNTPLLMQLFFWYFGLPSLLPREWVVWLNSPHPMELGALSLGWPSFEFVSAIVGLVFYSTAYVGEEIRAGINGVPRSQTQAAQSLGMTRWQQLRHIVLPQALAKIVSPLCGQYMNIVKNTSLGMTIGLAELSYRARQVEAETFLSFQVYGITTMLYILLIVGLEWLSRRLQRRARLQPREIA